MDGFENARWSGTGAPFAGRLLESLDIRFRVDAGDLERIPARSPAIIVANHPYGIVEGLILMAMLDRVRRDLKIVANSLLGGIPELREQMILVNPFQTPTAQIENRAPLRAALDWLARGGLLSVFPAGEVAHLDWKELSVTDPQWRTSAARLALRARCAVVPAFFEGANSIPFQLRGSCTPDFEPWRWHGSSAECGAGPSACGSARPSVTPCWRGTEMPNRRPPTCDREHSFYRIDPSPRTRPSRHSPRRGSGRSHRRGPSRYYRGK
jgi:hypothetical protein